jgi:hypothetical protein
LQVVDFGLVKDGSTDSPAKLKKSTEGSGVSGVRDAGGDGNVYFTFTHAVLSVDR